VVLFFAMLDPLSKIPAGMRYYFGREAQLRREAENLAMQVFDGWSYEEIVTPSVDYYSLFELGMGQHEASHAFRFTDDDGRLLALRPDVTSLVARAASTLFAKRARPLRFSYAAPIYFRQPRSHAEWRRETMQVGCELIGRQESTGDAEVLALAVELLEKLGLSESVRITINNVEIFNGIAENLRMDERARDRMRELINLRDAAGLESFLRPFANSDRECHVFAELTQLSGKIETLSEARSVIDNCRSVAALDSLEQLWAILEGAGLSRYFEIDLGDVSGLNYYTGLIFKIYAEGAGARIGGGGRYDKLIANFGRSEPAVGFVLDLEPVTESMLSQRNGQNTEAALPVSEADVLSQFKRAMEYRRNGQRVRIDNND
jgi:ATP phosphoribosyltransferase regulatory subunit